MRTALDREDKDVGAALAQFSLGSAAMRAANAAIVYTSDDPLEIATAVLGLATGLKSAGAIIRGPVDKPGGGNSSVVKPNDKEPTRADSSAPSRPAAGPVFRTTKEASAAAASQGFSRIAETVNGQAVFKRGNLYITRDIDGHNGGAWKMARSVSGLASKSTRLGTFDATLQTRIGD
jgi:hypothetical protein